MKIEETFLHFFVLIIKKNVSGRFDEQHFVEQSLKQSAKKPEALANKYLKQYEFHHFIKRLCRQTLKI